MCRVTIVNQPATVLTRRETILAAALDAGIPYPHDCRSGTCGTCKSRLLEGRVDLLPYAPEALDEAEAASGLILACRATARTDAVVEWLGEADDALPPVRRLKARVRSLEVVAAGIARLRLEVLGQPLYFVAGQYADLSFGRRPARAFSMANAPGDCVLEFHIRRLNGVASGYVAERLRVGDRVRIKGPFGNAWLRPHRRPIVAIAGGAGFAPIRSIILTALERDDRRPVHLYFGVRDEPDLYALDELKALAARHANFRFVPVLSAPAGPSVRRTGFVHEAVAADFSRLDGHTVHIAGPPLMVEAATAVALARGVERRAIHSDPFLPAPEASSATGLIDAFLAWRATFERTAG